MTEKFDKFADYMYYLLTSPFKKVKKSANQWYILLRTLGKRYDEAMESLYDARDQTMLATCDPAMLPVHAAERKLSQLPGESAENFRARLANYQEVLRLGGTDEGVLLAVRSLGYDAPELVPAKVYTGDEGRWAEFYIVITLDGDVDLPISNRILRQQVRKVKQVGAKDNYCFIWRLRIEEQHDSQRLGCFYHLRAYYFPYIRFDGSWLMDGSVTLDAKPQEYPLRVSHKARIQSGSEKIQRAECHEEHNLFYFDGSWVFDGSKKLDAWQRTEEL